MGEDKKYRPVPRVRLTLTPAMQNRCLTQMATAFGIMESFDRAHEITCFPGDFAHFMSLLAQMDKPPTIKQLRMDFVDIRKDVMRTTVSVRNHVWNESCSQNVDQGDLDE